MFSKIKFLFLFTLIIASTAGKAQTQNELPFILQDEQKLIDFKKQYAAGNKDVKLVVDSLIVAADKALKQPAYSVTYQKIKLPSNGNIHDYISQAPYWWPDSSKKDGKPYKRKDGRINPERKLWKDNQQMGQLCEDVNLLGLTYYFTGNVAYSKKAVSLLQTWFIDTATRMNPNLNFGQFIPGITDGRGIGIIETVGLTNVPDAVAMMQKSKEVTAGFVTNLKQWFTQYTAWLQTSKNGKDERSQINNHGTYYDLQLSDFALFIGDKKLARKVITDQTFPRIDQQFTVDGAEPLELIRTKSWSYATMNLVGWCKLAVVTDRIGIDLWHQQTMDGKGIRRVFEWFTPYLLKEKEWKYEQIEPVSFSNILSIFWLANKRYANAFEKVIALYPNNKLEKPWW